MEPPRRCLPAPRPISHSSLSTSRSSSGVSCWRTSATGANAEITSDTGDTLLCAWPWSCHCACIDSESLPTGMLMSSCGHSSMPTAFTASYSSASSPGWPAAAIQFADSLISSSASTGAAHRLVNASPTAIRAEAAASSRASGVRSPIDIASPATPSKSATVMATSATGSCHGPTICSRAVRPPTLRSPMVTRKFFEATVGCASTRRPASCRSRPAVFSAGQRGAGGCAVSRCIFGGLPNSTSIGRSIGASAGVWPGTAP